MESVFGFWLPNLILNQYQLALGEFNTEEFGAGSQMALCWLFFSLATFFSLILMLNMLIAIMGDTYERVMESKDINAVKTKLEIMGEQAFNMHKLDLFPTKAESAPCDFMYVVTLDDDADQADADTWEGSIKQMSKMTQQCILAISKMFL